MKTPGTMQKGCQKILACLAVFSYLTAEQLAKACFSPGSLTYVKALLKELVESKLVFALGGRGTSLPLIYTLTSTGQYRASTHQHTPRRRIRVRPADIQDKAHNPYFMAHTLAVNDALISARLLSQTHPGIALTRMYREPELKRKIYVEIPEKICLEPDASVQFTITETWHKKPQIWEDFFHIEVYRNLPPVEWRFKQKIAGYVTYAVSGQHEELFATPVLSVAVIAASEPMAATLKRWTEDVLANTNQQGEGDWFFFCSLDTATATPEEMYLAPVWEQAFGTAKTPLLMLEGSQTSLEEQSDTIK
jgi:hypothetical protein